MKRIFSIFRKLFKKHKKADDRGCWNCKHTNKSFDVEPCCWCDTKNSGWEAQK